MLKKRFRYQWNKSNDFFFFREKISANLAVSLMDHIKENVHIKSRSMGRGRFISVSEDRLSIVKLIFGVSRLRLFAT